MKSRINELHSLVFTKIHQNIDTIVGEECDNKIIVFLTDLEKILRSDICILF